MKLWILGKTGLLGNALVNVCKGLDFVATTRGEADITDLDSLKKALSEINPTHIVNCTAFNDVDGAESKSDQAFSVNSLGPENLGKLGKKVIHISTDYVFDGAKRSPYLEEDSCNPLSVYGKSKREGELKLLSAAPNALIIRTSWLFGTGGKNFISSLVNLLRTQTELKIAADQIGSPTYAPDLARTILSLLDHSGIYHFANAGQVSRLEIAEYFLEVAKERGIPLNCKSLIPFKMNFLAPRPDYSVLGTSKINTPRSWKEAAEEYIDASL